MKHDEARAGIGEQAELASPLRRRKAQIRESNEAHLLACAEAVFAEKGLEGASTAMIAERAGLPKANLHYYFPTSTRSIGACWKICSKTGIVRRIPSNAVTIPSM